MRYQIVYSDAAQYDLLKIWNDIYEVSADMNTADSYIDGIMNAFKKKQSFPRSGSPLESRVNNLSNILSFHHSFRIMEV